MNLYSISKSQINLQKKETSLTHHNMRVKELIETRIFSYLIEL